MPSEKKTKQKDYLTTGILPIVDQGLALIGGYTNDETKTIACDLPVIVFGDHTCCVKYIDFPFCAGADGIKVIKPSRDLLPKYLYYEMQCLVLKLTDRGYGRHYQHLEKMSIDVPSIPEQVKIVAQIENQLSQLDSALETLKKTKQQLEVYRQAVLKEAFDGNLTNSGKAQNDILKKYIEKPKYGTSKKCSYLADDTYKPVYRIPNINTKTARIVHTDIKYAHFDKKELETIRLQNNDLLIIRSNGSVSLVGRVALVTDDDTQGTFAGYLMRLRIINQQMLFPKYLLWYLQSKSAREYIERKAKSTSGVNNINSEEISNLTIPYYNLQSQKEIVEAIESRISIFDSIQQVVTTSLQQAEALRQSILKQAFEGML